MTFYGDVTVNTDTTLSGNASVGGTDQLGQLTVTEGDSGLMTAGSNVDTAVLQNNGNIGITFATPPGYDAYIGYASGTDNTHSYQYHDSDLNQFRWYPANGSGGEKFCFWIDGDTTNPVGVPVGAGNMIADGYDVHSAALRNGKPVKEIYDTERNQWLTTAEEIRTYIANHPKDGRNHRWRYSPYAEDQVVNRRPHRSPIAELCPEEYQVGMKPAGAYDFSLREPWRARFKNRKTPYLLPRAGA